MRSLVLVKKLILVLLYITKILTFLSLLKERRSLRLVDLTILSPLDPRYGVDTYSLSISSVGWFKTDSLGIEDDEVLRITPFTTFLGNPLYDAKRFMLENSLFNLLGVHRRLARLISDRNQAIL